MENEISSSVTMVVSLYNYQEVQGSKDMSLLNIFWDAASDVIDAYFIQSELKEIHLTEAEQFETAFYDSLANSTVDSSRCDGVPIGKQVW